MSGSLVRAYLRQFGDMYLSQDILTEYPEARTIPRYIREHFALAQVVLDLGFGPGLWFWASFLPALKRLDGFDAYPEALEEAERVFQLERVPAGYRIAHAAVGEDFTLLDLKALKLKRGHRVIQDYLEPWPDEIAQTRYDLVAEHGGGLGDMQSEDDFRAVIRKSAAVLKPAGCMLFVNFQMKERSELARQLGKSAGFQLSLSAGLYHQAVEQAGMRMIDFHSIDQPTDMPRVQTFLYGYAQKPPAGDK